MLQRRLILLVDDSENDRIFMQMAFKTAKCSIPLQEVCNGEEAISYLKGEGPYGARDKFPLPTVVLLDLNMPRKDGFDVLTWVRAQPILKRMVIVVLTASTRGEDVNRAFDLGATSFLVKPSSMEALAAMVRCLDSWIQINRFPSIQDEKPR